MEGRALRPEMKSGEKSTNMTFGELCEKIIGVNAPHEPELFREGSTDGLVASVDPSDLQRVWRLFREIQSQVPGQNIGIGTELYKRACSPGANIQAVFYRVSMLRLCEPMGLLASLLHDDELDDRVFEVAAKFPMKPMKVGVPQKGFPFDVEEFLRQAGQAKA